MVAFLTSLIRRTETRALAIWLAGAGSIWGFLSLAEEVDEGETEAFDRSLLLMLRTPGDPTDPLGSDRLEESLRDVTALGGFTVLALITVVAALALIFHRQRLQAAVLTGTALFAMASSEILKVFYDRPRPDLVPHGSFVYSQSFPSGHSTLAVAVYLTLATVAASLEPHRSTKRLIYAVATVLIVTIGFSRVYLGVHWPSDVLAGWALGSTWAFAAWIVLDRARRRKSAPVQPF